MARARIDRRHCFDARRRPGPLGVALGLALLMLLAMSSAARAESLARICRESCQDDVAACVAQGGSKRECRSQILRACRRDGVAVCLSSGEGRRRPTSAVVTAPSNLTASAVSSTQVALAWGDAGTETSQTVERSTAALSGFTVI